MNSRRSVSILWMPALFVLVSLACSMIATPQAATAQPAQGSAPQESEPALSQVDLPAERSNQAGDQDSSANATKKLVSGGEKFVKGLFERPFNTQTMDTYFPYLDIVDTQGFKDADWGFETIKMAGDDANGKLPAKYAAELDLNKDGRGEWLILVSNPSSTEWAHKGVQVWHDANGDVGGKQPTISEEHITGDGYEALAFDGDNANGKDDARARVSVEDPNLLQIAFRLSMVGNPISYAMGAWAGTNALDPAKFDMNDHMTHMQAGSPLPDLYVYPLKDLAEVDNTCRMAIGFVPTGDEPGLCVTIQKHDAPLPGCTPPAAGIVYPCP